MQMPLHWTSLGRTLWVFPRVCWQALCPWHAGAASRGLVSKSFKSFHNTAVSALSLDVAPSRTAGPRGFDGSSSEVKLFALLGRQTRKLQCKGTGRQTLKLHCLSRPCPDHGCWALIRIQSRGEENHRRLCHHHLRHYYLSHF